MPVKMSKTSKLFGSMCIQILDWNVSIHSLLDSNGNTNHGCLRNSLEDSTMSFRKLGNCCSVCVCVHVCVFMCVCMCVFLFGTVYNELYIYIYIYVYIIYIYFLCMRKHIIMKKP